MVTYFSENDLISFGNFILSDVRKAGYIEGLSEDKIEEVLNTVNPADVKNWFSMIIKKRQEDKKEITQITPPANEG